MVRVIQVFMQLGKTVGTGAGGDEAGGAAGTTGAEVCPTGEFPVLETTGALGIPVLGGEGTVSRGGDELPVAGGGGAGVPVAGGGGAIHWVHMVEIDVLVMVEIVVSVSTDVTVPEVMVLVTGQVVSVV